MLSHPNRFKIFHLRNIQKDNYQLGLFMILLDSCKDSCYKGESNTFCLFTAIFILSADTEETAR